MFTQHSATLHNRDTNKKLVKILHSLLQMDQSAPFRKPVPHKALGLGDYKKIVKKPIDLNQIRRQNNQARYKTIQEALDDIELCWENCKLYNHATSDVYQQALALEKLFWKMVQENFPEIYASAEPKMKEVQANEAVIAALNPQPPNPQPYASRNEGDEVSHSEPVQGKSEREMIVEESSEHKPMPVQGDRLRMNEEGEESRNSRMEEQNNESMNEQQEQQQQQQGNENKSVKSQQKESLKQPIEVHLRETPSAQNIARLTTHMKSIQDKAILEQVLQILFTYEKENMVASPKGHMHFRIETIHLSTFYRICKVVRLDIDDGLEIIQ